ncbi:MAG: class I SAM-dependent methyltransferase [Candidatus Heimdallarchaeota archaeon]
MSEEANIVEKSWKDIYAEKKEAAALFQTKPRPIVEEFIALLQERGGGELLDLGCGYGNYLPYFSRRGFSVIGSDISTIALRVARKRLSRPNQDNICLILHDMRVLPFCDESFVGIFSMNTIYHATMTEVQRVVSEIYRVLKDKGVCLVTLLSDTDFKFDRTLLTGKKTLQTDTEFEKGVVHSFFNREDACALLANFEIIKLEKEDIRFENRVSSHWFALIRKNSPIGDDITKHLS